MQVGLFIAELCYVDVVVVLDVKSFDLDAILKLLSEPRDLSLKGHELPGYVTRRDAKQDEECRHSRQKELWSEKDDGSKQDETDSRHERYALRAKGNNLARGKMLPLV